MTAILGVSEHCHDSAAALAVDGEIIGAAREGRYIRKKHEYAFPVNAIDVALQPTPVAFAEWMPSRRPSSPSDQHVST